MGELLWYRIKDMVVVEGVEDDKWRDIGESTYRSHVE